MLSEVYNMGQFEVSEEVPLTYRTWIEWCRAKEIEKRPLSYSLFEELSNREARYKLLEEADRRLCLTKIALEEEPTFPDLFEKVQEIANLEQLLFKIEPLKGELREKLHDKFLDKVISKRNVRSRQLEPVTIQSIELSKKIPYQDIYHAISQGEFTQYQKELQKEIDTLLSNFSLLKENTDTLKKWQLDCESLMKNPKYREEMTGEQRHQLEQLACQYGYWVKRTGQLEKLWASLEPDLLKDKALQIGEIHLYSRSQSPHLIAFLQTAPLSERLEYARAVYLLSFFWDALQETLKTETPCRFHEVAKQWFQMLSEMQDQFGASQDPFIQTSLPLILQSSGSCMQPLISRIHERFVLLLNDDKKSSIEAVLMRLEKECVPWFHHYRFFKKWEWIALFQSQVLQPTLEPYFKKADGKTFEKIARTTLLPWLKRYANDQELQHLVESAYDWTRELALKNPQTCSFDTVGFKKQIVVDQIPQGEIKGEIKEKIKQLTPPFWQTLNQKREHYKNPTDYTKEVIKTLDTALAFCLPFLGEAPCHWALLGLGSLGRGQLLPYSDFDIALLIENEEMRTHPHWKRLIHLLDTLTQLMDNAGYWDQEAGSYLFLGHHINEGDKKAMQGKKPPFIQTPQGFARWTAQTLHKVTKEDKEKSTSECLLAYSCLHSCLITSAGKGLFSQYQTELKKELKGKMDPIGMALAWQKEHGKDWQRALRDDNEVKKTLLSIKDSVFAPLNYYLLDHELLHLDKAESNDWLELMQEARQRAFQLRLQLEQRAKGRILLVKKAPNEKPFTKLTPFENALTLTGSELLLIDQLQGVGAVAYNAIFNVHNTTHPLHIQGISLGEIHPSLKEYWATGIAAVLTFGKESDLKIQRRLYRLMPVHMRFEYENALKRFSKTAPQAEHLLKKILPSVPLPNGNRGSFLPRQEKWQKIITSLIEPCDPKNIPKEATGVLISWVENHQTLHGILKKEFAEQLLDKNGQFPQDKKLPDGRRCVILLCDKNKKVIVYPKAYPELPGRQLAADCLAYRITGSSVQASLVLFTPIQKGTLNEKTAYPVLLSKPAGQTIQNTIRKQEQLVNLSLYHFTLKVLATYILGYEDDKKDNVTLQRTVDEMGNPCWQLVSIDSDHVFSTPMVDTTTDSKILLKTVTFTFPEMIERLDPEAVADFLSLNKVQVLEQWLGECRLLNSALIGNLKQNRQGLFNPQLIQRCAPLDNWFSSDKFSFIPIAFQPGTIADIYQRWQRAEQILKAEKSPSTHFDFLQQTAPRLGQRYQQIFHAHPTVGKRFDTLAELYTDYKVTKEKGTHEKEEISHTSTHQVNVSKTLVGVKKFQEALMQGKIFDASGPFGVKELEDIQTHYQYLTELKKVFEVGLDVEDNKQQAVIETLEILLSKPYYSALIERVLSSVRFHYTDTNADRLLAFQGKLLNLLSQKSLQELTFIGWRALTEEKFLRLIEKSSDLQNLTISDCPNFKCSGATWAKLSISCPQLKSIRMSQVTEMPLSWRRRDVKFEELQSLSLEECPELMVYQVNALKLQQLTLKNCINLTKVDLSGQPIQRLRLDSCEQLMDAGFGHDIQGRHLQSIAIQKCKNVKSTKVYIQWPFLMGQLKNYYSETELSKIERILHSLELQPHEIPTAVLFILEQCERARKDLKNFQPTILKIKKALLPLLKDEEGAGFSSAKALVILAPSLSQEEREEVCDTLLPYLKSKYVDRSTAKALVNLATFLSQKVRQEVCNILLFLLEKEDGFYPSSNAKILRKLASSLSQRELREVCNTLVHRMKAYDSRLRSSSTLALGELAPLLSQKERGEMYDSFLLSLKHTLRFERLRSIQGLVKVAPFLTREKQREVCNTFLLFIKNKDSDVCYSGYSALGELAPFLSQEERSEVCNALLLFFEKKSTDVFLRCRAVHALGKLIHYLSKEKQHEVCIALLLWLKDNLTNVFGRYRIKTITQTLEKVVPFLSKEERCDLCNTLLLFLKDKDSTVRREGATFVGKLASSFPQEERREVCNFLLTLLKDVNEYDREKSAIALVKLASFLSLEERSEVYNTLMSFLTAREFVDDRIRSRSAKAIGMLAPSLSREELHKVLNDILPWLKHWNPDLRDRSAKILGSIMKNYSIPYTIKREIPKLRELLKNPISSSSTLLVEKDEKVEIIKNQRGPIWYSDSELEQLIRLQLPLETNSNLHIWAGAVNVQQLETLYLYAYSTQSRENSSISLIPIFLNAEENDFLELGNHWAILILVNVPTQNQKPRQLAIYQNPLGVEMPNSIKNCLKEWEVFDLQVRQQTNDNDCGPWIVYTAQTLVETLQESLPLFPSKEGLQKWITPLRENQGDELRQFYHKQLKEKQQSTSKLMNENSPPPSLPSNQSEQYDDGKEDVELN